MKAWLFPINAGWVAAACSPAGLTNMTLPLDSKSECARLLLDIVAKNGCVNQPPGRESELHHLGQALDEYYAGRRDTLNFAVDWSIFTPFQRDILQVVKEIPYGTLLTYGQVAAIAGHPRAARAAGGALRTNRVPLVIPCHRVVQSDGNPGGFDGQPWIKTGLLALEGLKIGPDGRYFLRRRQYCV